jgi:hypothetical protein
LNRSTGVLKGDQEDQENNILLISSPPVGSLGKAIEKETPGIR